MLRLRVLLLMVLPVIAAGCLGAATGPSIPAAALQNEGWATAGSPSSSTKAGLVEIVQQTYGPNGRNDVGGIMLVSASNVPFVDEARFIPAQIEAYEKSQGIRLVERGTEEIRLSNVGESVTATIYDVEGTPVAARALLAHFTCKTPGVFVAVVGYGALPASGSILQGGTPDLYGQAKRLVPSVTCGA